MRFHRLLLTATAALLAACGDGLGVRSGKTQVLLTDSPFPYDRIARVDVHIVRVQVSESADTTTNQNWTTVVEPRRTINLLELQAGKTTLLGESSVDAGKVGAVRVVINTSLSSVTHKNGQSVLVRWPVQGELALHSYIEASLASFTPGTPENLVIDFDVGRSFEDLNGDGSLYFLPWIRALNDAGAGAVAGIVKGPDGHALENVAVTVLGGDPDAAPTTWWKIATGKSDANGNYKVAFILQGTYIVRAEPLGAVSGGCMDKKNVVVSNGETATLNFDLPNPPGTCARFTSGGGGPDTSGTGGGTSGGAVETVTVTIWPENPVVGDSAGAYANLKNAQGASLYNRPVDWSVSDTKVLEMKAAFGQSLHFKPVGKGTATITAVSEGKTGTRTVTIP